MGAVMSAHLHALMALAGVAILMPACGDRSGSTSIDLMTIAERAEVRPSRNAIQPTIVTIGGVSRRSLASEGTTRVTWRLRLPARAVLLTSIGIVPEDSTRSASATFRVGVADDRVYEELLTRRVMPAAVAADRTWIPIDIDLGAYGGFQWSLFYRPGQQDWKVILNTVVTGRAIAAWAEPTILGK